MMMMMMMTTVVLVTMFTMMMIMMMMMMLMMMVMLPLIAMYMVIQGGNWITTDQFLRFSTSRARYTAEVRLHKEMGMNLIRVWGGGITERPEFFEACDRYVTLLSH
jgi:hypothetical protein